MAEGQSGIFVCNTLVHHSHKYINTVNTNTIDVFMITTYYIS